MRESLVEGRVRFDRSGPADHHRHTIAAFPVRRLLASEWRVAAIWPGHHFRAVVGREHHDGVLRHAKIIELLKQLADITVEFHQPSRRYASHQAGNEFEHAISIPLEWREGIRS